MSGRKSLALSVLVALAACTVAAAETSIDVLAVPPCTASGQVQGIVTLAYGSCADYEIATYIHVEGSGWWSKPTFANPTVPVDPSCFFSVPISDTGLDAYATIYCAALVPAGYSPPIANGDNCLPRDDGFVAMDCMERYCHTLEFGIDRTRGRQLTWGKKHAPLPVGPGDNRFCPDNAWVDQTDRLHLRVTEEAGGWCSAEVMMTEALGYGEYLFQSSTGVNELDSGVVFGAFTWDPYGDGSLAPGWQNREIDLAEDTHTFLIPDPDDSQYVVQPWNVAGHRHTYDLDTVDITRVLIWYEDRLEFHTVAGHHTLETWRTAPTIASWSDYADTIPQPGEARWRFNLWYPSPGVPADDGELEFLVDHFEYRAGLPGDANRDGAVTDADYTLWADHYGAVDASFVMGDFNGDGEVTDADYTIWADHYGDVSGSIPEPTSLLLFSILAALPNRRSWIHNAMVRSLDEGPRASDPSSEQRKCAQ